MKRFYYFIDKIMMRGVGAQLFFLLFFVFGVIFILSLFTTALYQHNLTTTVWQNFMYILDGGNLSGAEGSWGFLVLATIITFLGIFVWSALVAILNDGLQNKLQELSQGTAEALEEGHSIILGWNDEALPLVQEYILGGVKTVMILCDEDSKEIRRQIAFLKAQKTEILVRQGSPLDFDRLSLLNISQCSSIAILSTNDQEALKIILALKKQNQSQNILRISTTIYEEETRELCSSLETPYLQIFPLLKTEILYKLLAQSTVFNGLASIYDDLFSYEGKEFYFLPKKGKTYAENLEFSLTNNLYLVGVWQKDTVIFAPPLNFPLDDNAELIVICEDNPLFSQNKGTEVPSTCGNNISENQKGNILIISSQSYGQAIEHQILQYIAKNTQIYFCDLKKVNQESQKSVFLFDLLSKNNISRVVLMSPDHSADADIQIMNLLIRLRHLIHTRSLNLTILTELNSIQNRDLIADDQLKDFIVSGKLTGMFMAQTSLNPKLLKVFEQLLDKAGKEIVILPLATLGLNIGMSCKDAVNSLSIKEKALIGIKRDNKIYLCPCFDTILEDGDEPIVILDS